jgi:hypothetical protein
MESIQFDDAQFRRSRFCSSGGCVEVAVKGGAVGVRDSKSPDSAVLVFDREEWSTFVAGVRAGEFSIE